MKDAGALSLFLVGDVGIHREKPETIFAAVRQCFEQADVLIGNSEYPLTDRGQPWPGKRDPIRRADPRIAPVLKEAGFTAVSLATNHTMDFGVEGILQTIETLDESGIAHAGAGRTAKEAHAPSIIEKKACALRSYRTLRFFSQATPPPKLAQGLPRCGSRPSIDPLLGLSIPLECRSRQSRFRILETFRL